MRSVGREPAEPREDCVEEPSEEERSSTEESPADVVRRALQAINSLSCRSRAMARFFGRLRTVTRIAACRRSAVFPNYSVGNWFSTFGP